MPRPKKHKIVIVDSDAFLAGIYARRFEMGAWKVRVAESIHDARRIISDMEPDVVLIDIDVDPSGVEFLQEMRASKSGAKTVLVVLTKLGDRGSIEKALKAGADSYLLKGHFVPTEVREKIERLVS